MARLSAGRGPSAPAASRSRQHGGPGRLPRALPAGPGFPADGLISAAPDRSRRAQSGARSTRRAGAPSAPDRVSGRAVGGLGGGAGRGSRGFAFPSVLIPRGPPGLSAFPSPSPSWATQRVSNIRGEGDFRAPPFSCRMGTRASQKPRPQGLGSRQSGAHRSTGPGTLLAGGMLATPRPG